MHGEFSYISIVSQLNCLQGYSRSNIILTTSQTAQYVNNSKCSYESALIQVGHYLKGRIGKGIISKPVDAKSLWKGIYVDAIAFDCGWGTKLSTNIGSV